MTSTDPIEFSIFLSRMRNVVDEMSVALGRAAMTPIIALCHDFSCCIYDVQARQVAVHDALPIQTSSMDLLISETATAFRDDLAPGDVILCNDPYRGNTHVGDLVVLCPVFLDGRHLFWSCARAHQLDIGAPLPTTTTPWAADVWQEGLAVPPTKIYAAGRRREDVLELYLRNLRWRELLLGDLMAQLGAIWTGARRLQELADDLGVERVLEHVDHAIEYGRRRTAAEIAAMPDGRYEAEGWMDADGAGRTSVPVRAAVEIAGERVHVDFAGTAAQSQSGFNASRAVVEAAGRIPLIMAIDPDIPHNQGCLDAVTVVAEPGSVALATFPASTGGATTWPGDVLQDVVWRALVQAVPERVRAGTARWNNAPELYGSADGDAEPWGLVLLNGGGGGGAARGCDGWPLITSPAAEGGLKIASIEETELLHPLVFAHWEIEPDSMGAGEWNGGPGIRVAFRPTGGAIDVFNPSDGLDNAPHGVLGGTAGGQGGSFVQETDGSRTYFASVYTTKLSQGQTWTGVSSGGGGYGDPLRRDPRSVAADLRDELIGYARTTDVYGVVVDRDGRVDAAATAALRERLAAARPAGWEAVVPAAPVASTWAERAAGPQDRVVRDGAPVSIATAAPASAAPAAAAPATVAPATV
ncbi:MAG TPA: hydantoinase B/oxoprolinase family protein [Conexibacter sp.]|nr:hydantoinase B/oxoprolinase family protein [Conexibacter sp.]